MFRRLAAVAATSALLAGCGYVATGSPGGQAGVSLRVAKDQHLTASFAVDGVAGGRMRPGVPARWSFAFADATSGNPFTRFERNHEKFMHLIAVSADLDTFAHLHPDFDGRRFDLGVNQASADPDNQDAARAVPKAGSFLLFGEVKPAGSPVETVRFDFQAEGAAEPVPLRPDPGDPAAGLRKYFRPDGSAGQFGDVYQVTLGVERMAHHPGHEMLHLNVNIQAAHTTPHGVHYMPVKDLQTWLGMPGHGVLIGAAGTTAATRQFRHLHAGHDHGPVAQGPGHPGEPGQGAGPDLTFMLDGAEIPPAGLYKLWGQFKHRDRVLTLPFIFKL